MAECPSKPVAEVTGFDVVQFVVHGAMVPNLVQWLTSQEFYIAPSTREADDLDTYMVFPTRKRMEGA